MPVVSITVDTEFPSRRAADPLGTFDRVLEILAVREVIATFFVVGTWARAHPERVMALTASGHSVGSHGHVHARLAWMTEIGIVADLEEAHLALAELGVDAKPLFRAPFGDLEHPTLDVEATLSTAGYRHVGWDAHGDDWRPTRSSQDVAAQTLDEIHRCWPSPPATVLFHSWPDPAPDALELVLDRMERLDAEFAPLDRLHERRR